MKTWIEVNKRNLLYNFRIFSRLVSPAKIIAVVKANAYGHGLGEVAKILSLDAEFQKNGWFGVDSLEEAQAVKKISSARIPIIILGFTREAELEEVVKNKFRQVVYHPEQIKKLQLIAEKMKTTALIHLKLETGTNRQGVGERELPKIIVALKNAPRVHLEGAYSHFADIEDKTSNIFAIGQLNHFQKLIDYLVAHKLNPKLRHMAASAASLLYKESHLDFIRLGISLYGLHSLPPKKIKKINPHTYEIGVGVKLRPVLSWKTLVAQLKTIKTGETVGYGRTWRAKVDSHIAVLPIGYADGYSRSFGNNARVLINRQYAPIVGRICMNMCMADVTKIKNIKVEDKVVIIGRSGNKEITADELAKLDGTINYEIIARLNPLINRKII